MAWNLDELRSEVARTQGKQAAFKLTPYLNSICERQDFARYHYHEAKDSLNHYMEESVSEMELFRLVMTGKGDDPQNFPEQRFKARAHVLACVQSLHSISDILGHAIYYALNLQCAKTDRQITLFSVARWLQSSSECEELQTPVSELVSHDDYRYMNALANHSKHRSIVSLGLSFNFRKAGNEMKELVFPHFSYEGRDYLQRKVFEVLESEYDRQGRLVNRIGNALNAAARAR